jgi:zinc/manganese transport system substrate-binding protein
MNPRIVLRTGAVLALALLLAAPPSAAAKVKVVASLTDLGSIAATVGGDQVEVTAVARPASDAHRVEVLPSYMVRVSRAQLYLKVGLGLDQWADQIIDGSRNAKLKVLDCARHIEPLEKPTGRVDASLGDVHPDGNPHYWLDPRNGALVARGIAEALAGLDPAHADDFRQRAAAFAQECAASQTAAAATVAALPVKAVITYHSSWVYFAHATGLEIAGTVEPVPGIPPTARHLQELIGLIRERKVPVVLQEPYFSNEAPAFLAREAGVRVAMVSASCDDVTPGSYLAHFNHVVERIVGR